MSSVLADKQVLVFDRGGLFTHIAVRMAEYCKEKPLLYYTEWRESFSRSSKRMPGVGLPNVIRVDDFHAVWPEADLIIFPDIGDSSLQMRLREDGKLVWGSGLGGKIEEDKIGFNLWLASSGLPSPDMYLIEGTEALEDFLRNPDNEDYWLKSNDRGDLETYHHTNWLRSEDWFRHLVYILGPNRHMIKIIAQKAVEAKDEIGYDGYMIDGKMPESGIYGFEDKNNFYVGKFTSKFPNSIIATNEAMGQECEGLGYRGAFSTEIREADDGNFYFIDPTMRFGLPPSSVMIRWYSNWDDIMFYGSMGELVEPIPESGCLWGAEVILKANTQENDFLPVSFPEECRSSIMLHQHCIINDVDYICPKGDECFGSAVGYGSTPEQAAQAAIDIAREIKADEFSFDEAAKDRLLEVINSYESS